MTARSWSLGRELGAIESALHGCAVLVEQLGEHRDDAATASAIAEAVRAILGIAHARLHTLGAVLFADSPTDAAPLITALHAAHNGATRTDVPDAVVHHGGDVLFLPAPDSGAAPRPRGRPR